MHVSNTNIRYAMVGPKAMSQLCSCIKTVYMYLFCLHIYAVAIPVLRTITEIRVAVARCGVLKLVKDPCYFSMWVTESLSLDMTTYWSITRVHSSQLWYSSSRLTKRQEYFIKRVPQASLTSCWLQNILCWKLNFDLGIVVCEKRPYRHGYQYQSAPLTKHFNKKESKSCVCCFSVCRQIRDSQDARPRVLANTCVSKSLKIFSF